MTIKMTEQQFREWAATAAFTAEESIEGATAFDKATGDYDDDTGKRITVDGVYGWACKTVRATLPDGSAFETFYQMNIEWVGTERERYTEDFEAEEGEGLPAIELQGVTLVDKDGDALQGWEVDSIAREAIPGLTEINHEALIPAVITTDIDLDEESTDMETITLENDNAPAIRFTGELVAETSSSNNNASSYYSGQTGRWTTLKLYKTKGGKFIAQSVGHTQWQGEHDRYKSAVCENEAAVIAFFGHGWLAKDLYEEAGIEDVQEVE